MLRFQIIRKHTVLNSMFPNLLKLNKYLEDNLINKILYSLINIFSLDGLRMHNVSPPLRNIRLQSCCANFKSRFIYILRCFAVKELLCKDSYFRGVRILCTAVYVKRRMSQPDKKNQWNILVIGNYHVNYQNEMLLSSSDTRGTLMHLFLSTNTAQPKENWFQLYAENTQTQLTFLALLPCIVLTTIWFNEKQEGVKPRRCSWTA